ncbi:MAG TPA: hypothetical protein VMI31_00235 [Fimbriimonadaceae bacterium]|nr:hypothetical protein [Fimbriimonadaceae bacterium]
MPENLSVPETGAAPKYAAYPRGVQAPLIGTSDEIRAVAEGFGKVSLATLVWLLGIVASFFAIATIPGMSGPAGLAALYVFQLPSVVMAVRAMNQARPAHRWGDASVVVAAVLLWLVPFGAMLFLASVSGRCSEYLKKAGVRIGVTGIDKATLKAAIELRRQPSLPSYGPEFH